eukprot:4955181-Pleurochrysis_carterae.AAC.1
MSASLVRLNLRLRVRCCQQPRYGLCCISRYILQMNAKTTLPATIRQSKQHEIPRSTKRNSKALDDTVQASTSVTKTLIAKKRALVVLGCGKARHAPEQGMRIDKGTLAVLPYKRTASSEWARPAPLLPTCPFASTSTYQPWTGVHAVQSITRAL